MFFKLHLTFLAVSGLDWASNHFSSLGKYIIGFWPELLGMFTRCDKALDIATFQLLVFHSPTK